MKRSDLKNLLFIATYLYFAILELDSPKGPYFYYIEKTNQSFLQKFTLCSTEASMDLDWLSLITTPAVCVSVCLNLTLHHQLQREGSGFDLRPLIHQAGDFFSIFCRCRDHPILALHGHRPVPLGH